MWTIVYEIADCRGDKVFGIWLGTLRLDRFILESSVG